MNVIEWELLILSFSCAVTVFALNWILQSTVLIALGLCAGRLLHGRGAAFQSALYRTTLAVVLVCPIASFALSSVGLDIWAIDLPAGFVFDEVAISKTAPTGPQTPYSLRPAGTTAVGNDAKTLPSENGRLRAIGEFNGSIDLKSRESELRDEFVPAKELYPPIIHEGQSEIAIVRRNEIRNVAIRRFGFFSIVVTIAWAVIATTIALRIVSKVIAMNRLRSQSILASSEAIVACKRIASEMGVNAPQVLRAPFVTSPFLHGIWRPAIIIPDQAEVSLTNVFVHELAHLRRFDCHWLLLRHVATTILFFQPLLWWLARRIDVTSEEVCDDCVVQFGSNRESYANSLVDIATLFVAPVAFVGVGMISLRSMLGRRVARILDTERLLSTRVGNWIRGFMIGSGLIAVSIVGVVSLSITNPTAATTIFAEEKSDDGATDSNSSTESANQSSENTPAPTTNPPTGDISVSGRIVDDSNKPASVIANEQRPLENRTITGTVSDPDGMPVVGARVVAVQHHSAPHDISGVSATSGPTDREMRQLGETTTDETGGFSMIVLKPVTQDSKYSHISVFAAKDAFAADEASELEIANVGRWNLRLATNNRVIQGRIFDSESRPAVGAKVAIVRVEGATEPIDGWLERAKSNPEKIDVDFNKTKFNESNSTFEVYPSRPGVAIFPTSENHITPSILSKSPTVTDANGEFSIAGMGDDRLVTLRLDGDTIVSALLQVVTRDMPAVNAPDIVVANRTKKVHGCNFVYASESTQWIEGTIRDKISRQPINDVLVYVMGSDGMVFIQSRSDKEGKYLLKGLPKNPENSSFGLNGLYVGAQPSYETPYFPNHSWAQQRQADQPIRMDIDLHRGIWIEGQATDPRTHRPVPVVVSYHPDMDNPHFAGLDINLLARDQESRIMRGKPTADGKFRIRGFPGKGLLRVVSVENDAYQLFSSSEMQKAIKKFKGIPVTLPQPGHAIVELNIPVIEKPYQVLPKLIPLETTNLHFVDEEGREVTDCFVEGNLPKSYTQVYVASHGGRSGGKTYPNSNVEFHLGEGEERDRHLIIQHAERKIGAIVAPEELARFGGNTSTTIVLRHNATVKGRLVNEKKEVLSGFPDAGIGFFERSSTILPKQRYGIFVDSTTFFPSRFKTYLPNPNAAKLNQDGSFELSLPAAKGYAIQIVANKYHVLFLRDRDLSPGEQLDLGTIDVTADPKNWPTPRRTLNAGKQ